MSTITIPESLKNTFVVSAPARICDENGNILGYYTPRREATDEDYEWLMKSVSKEETEASLKSGSGRLASEIIPELIRKYGL